MPEDPTKPEAPTAGEDLPLSLTVLGGSARADAAVPMPSPSGDPVRRGVWAQAGAVFVFVTVVGVAEARLLGMPSWLDVVWIALGCVLAADRVYLARRAKPAEDRSAGESFTSLAVPAAAGAPAALPAAPRREAAPDAAEPLQGAAPEERPPADEDVSAAASEANGSAAASGANGSAADEPRTTLPALGYTCAPLDEYGRGLAGDTEEITAWCAERGLAVARIVHDVERQAGEQGGGPALQWALDQIATGAADTIVVARLRSLSPTVANLPPLLRWFTEPERRLVAIDMQLDTATDAGRLAACALAGAGSWEHERLSARTRRGLEAARSRGAGRAGAAVADVPELRERIVRLRSDGMTLQAIADVLNEEGVPTLRGGAKWRPSSVQGATGYRRPASTRGIHVPDESPGPRQGPSNKR